MDLTKECNKQACPHGDVHDTQWALYCHLPDDATAVSEKLVVNTYMQLYVRVYKLRNLVSNISIVACKVYFITGNRIFHHSAIKQNMHE